MMLRFLTLLILTFTSAQLHAHARLKPAGSIPPRSSNAGIKTGPCGNIARGPNATTIAPGATVTVEWEETINHPGRFEFYFSPAGDANWTLLKSVPDTQDGGGLPHQYTTDITFPNTPCTDCTLQMIQVMTENPASPSLYYSCANIRLQSAPNPPPPPPPPPPVDPEPCDH
jgi:hypothetical protein